MTPDQARMTARQLTVTYHRTIERIDADKNISEEHRTKLKAAAWVQSKDAFAELDVRMRAAASRERSDLEAKYLHPKRSLMETPSERVSSDASYRDALARAGETATTEQLVGLVRRSARVGDDLQRRAALAVAYERMDLDAINAYLEGDPDAEPDLQRLFNVTATSGQLTKNDLELAMALAAPSPPLNTRESVLRELAGAVPVPPGKTVDDAYRQALSDGSSLQSVS